jgi:hypothetical protein
MDTGDGVLGTNMYCYCSNNPIIYRDSNGDMAELALAAGPAIGVAGTMAAAGGTNAWNPVGWVLLGAAVVVAGVAIGSTIYNDAQAKKVEIANSVGSIASKYPYGKCVEAAKAIEKYVIKNGIDYSVIAVVFPGDIVGSQSTGKRVSDNHFHIGINIGGTVFCNIHPYGLKKKVWVKDFYDLKGSKAIVIELGSVSTVLKNIYALIAQYGGNQK